MKEACCLGKAENPVAPSLPTGLGVPPPTLAPRMDQGCSGFIVSCPFSPFSTPVPPNPSEVLKDIFLFEYLVAEPAVLFCGCVAVTKMC